MQTNLVGSYVESNCDSEPLEGIKGIVRAVTEPQDARDVWLNLWVQVASGEIKRLPTTYAVTRSRVGTNWRMDGEGSPIPPGQDVP